MTFFENGKYQKSDSNYFFCFSVNMNSEVASVDFTDLVLSREEVDRRDDCAIFEFMSPFHPTTCKFPQRGTQHAAGYDLCAPKGGRFCQTVVG